MCRQLLSTQPHLLSLLSLQWPRSLTNIWERKDIFSVAWLYASQTHFQNLQFMLLSSAHLAPAYLRRHRLLLWWGAIQKEPKLLFSSLCFYISAPTVWALTWYTLFYKAQNHCKEIPKVVKGYVGADSTMYVARNEESLRLCYGAFWGEQGSRCLKEGSNGWLCLVLRLVSMTGVRVSL